MAGKDDKDKIGTVPLKRGIEKQDQPSKTTSMPPPKTPVEKKES